MNKPISTSHLALTTARDKGRKRNRERFRERMDERRAAGRCLSCGTVPPVPGRTTCEPCAEKRRAKEKARNEKLKAEGKPRRCPEKARESGRRHYRRRVERRTAAGVCHRCGAAPPAPGRKICHDCGEKLRVAARERYHAGKEAGMKYGGRSAESRRRSARLRSERKRREWVDAGRCSRCGKSEPAEGGSTCTPCRTRRQERDKAKYKERRDAGVCTRCGHAPAFDGTTTCLSCNAVAAGSERVERRNAASRKRYWRRRQESACTDCGLPSHGASRCPSCAERSYVRSAHFRGMPAWEPEYTVVDLDTGEEHGPFDSRADADAGAAFLRLPPGRFEVVAGNHPLAGSVGWW